MRNPQQSLSSKTGHAEFLAIFSKIFGFFFGRKGSEVKFANQKISFSPETLHNDRLDTLVSVGGQRIGKFLSILAGLAPRSDP